MPPLPRLSLLSSPFRQYKAPLLRRTFTTTPSRSTAKVTLVGRLAAEPELIPTASGLDMVRYAIGTQSGPSANRQTSWWKVGAFPPEGGQRDALLRLGKGSLMYVEGTCSMNKFFDKEGIERSAMNITQRYFEVLDRRNSDESRTGGGSEESQSELPE